MSDKILLRVWLYLPIPFLLSWIGRELNVQAVTIVVDIGRGEATLLH